MGGDGHVWTEAQEVTSVGLLVLGTVWYRADTAHWEQGLVGNRRTRETEYVYNSDMEQAGLNLC